MIHDDLDGIVASTPRKRLTPSKTIPKAQQDMPAVMGVNPTYQQIAGLHLLSGKFFDQDDEDRAAPVCVLGAAAKWSLFGSADPLGQYVKVNEQWFRVIGVVSPQLSAQSDSSGGAPVDVNNNIYVPLQSAFLRLEDSYSDVRDEIDGIYLNLGRYARTSPKPRRWSERFSIPRIMAPTTSASLCLPNCSRSRSAPNICSIPSWSPSPPSLCSSAASAS